MKTLFFPFIFLFTLIGFSQEEFDEFTATIIGDKEAFLSSKTGEFVFRAHDKTDVSNLRTNDNGVVIYTDKKLHTVKKGETLSVISRKHGLSVAEIKELNKLKSNNLKIGQAINIELKTIVKSSSPVVSQAEGRIIARLAPGQDRSGVTPPDLPPDAMPGNTINLVVDDKAPVKRAVKAPEVSNASELDDKSFHTVKSGESLFSIAKKYKMSMSDLKSINNLALNNVTVGQKLKIKIYNQEVQAPTSTMPKPKPAVVEAVETPKEKVVTETVVEKPKTTRKRVFRPAKVEAPKTKEVKVVENQTSKDEVPSKTEMKYLEKETKQVAKEKMVVKKEVVKDVKKPEITETEIAAKPEAKIVKEKVITKTPKAPAKAEVKSKVAKVLDKKVEPTEKEKRIDGLIKKYAKKDTSEAKATDVHVVKRGETLWSISRQHKLTVDALKKLNELKTNVLSVGQKLKVK